MMAHGSEAAEHVAPVRVRPRRVHDGRKVARAGDEGLCRLVAGERVVRLARPVDEDDVAARRERVAHPPGKPRDVAGRQVVDHLGEQDEVEGAVRVGLRDLRPRAVESGIRERQERIAAPRELLRQDPDGSSRSPAPTRNAASASH